MDNPHTVVWVDHKSAHIIKFNRSEKTSEIIRHHTPPGHIHHKAGTMGSGHVYEDDRYLREIADSLRDPGPILLVGPSQVKWQLKAFLGLREPAIVKRIAGVETLNHPTDDAILAMARQFFAKNDRLQAGK